MLVVDTNLIAYRYLSAGHAERLDALLRRDRDWVAPRLWRSELRNVLSAYVRRGLLRLEDGLAILDDAELLMGSRDFEPVSSAVLRLAQRSGCAAYDCEFVALAQDLGAPLLTYDRTLLERFAGVAQRPEDYLAATPLG
jgi:predicted nucleic acid-binding protein